MEQAVWAWAILGLVLLSVEMLSGTFYILWFGIAALCVAVVLFVFPDMPLAGRNRWPGHKRPPCSHPIRPSFRRW